MKHISVLLDESIEYLNIKKNGIYVDATLGYGGHSRKILSRIDRGCLFAFDQDEDAINYNKELEKNSHFHLIDSNFIHLKEKLNEFGIDKIDGIIFDLGVSSPQLDEKERGFSYHNDAKLDMRMDKRQEFSAYNVVNEYSYTDLVRIFKSYGDVKMASNIAKNIIKRRSEKPIYSTLELVEIIKEVIPYKLRSVKHPAKNVFQAIRIEVNDELNILKKALEDAISLLNKGGRICVITFHSKEDKIVKDIFKKYSTVLSELKDLPFIPDSYKPILKVIEPKGIDPKKEEIENNKRARSAKLRVCEKE